MSEIKLPPTNCGEMAMIAIHKELQTTNALLRKLLPKEETGEIRDIKETKKRGKTRKAKKTDTK